MKKQYSHLFSILELLIVMSVMAILATMIFVVVKGVKDGARMVQTTSTISTCKTSVENLYEYIFNESRKNSMEVYQHPLFAKVWPSNKVWTFRDKDETDKGITSNGLMNMIYLGSLGVENKSIVMGEMQFPDYTKPTGVKTLVDGWGFPILLMRNETNWHIKKLNPTDNIVENVYKNREKTSLGFYAKYMFRTDGTNQNLYEWNDGSFNHTDSAGVNEPSYEVAPIKADGFRYVQINGQKGVTYNVDDFDFFSPGKDGKIGNLIQNDMKQDRWTEVKNKAGALNWVPASAAKTDPDMDNIVSFNKYILN
jgi:hypothetical protein